MINKTVRFLNRAPISVFCFVLFDLLIGLALEAENKPTFDVVVVVLVGFLRS